MIFSLMSGLHGTCVCVDTLQVPSVSLGGVQLTAGCTVDRVCDTWLVVCNGQTENGGVVCREVDTACMMQLQRESVAKWNGDGQKLM